LLQDKNLQEQEIIKIKSDLFNLIELYNLDIDYKVKIYDLIISYYRKQSDYEQHEKYTMELFLLGKDNPNIVLNSLYKLIINYTQTNRSTDSKVFRELALNMCKDINIPDPIKIKTYYNSAIAFKDEKDSKCIECCNILLNNFNLPYKQILDIYLLKIEYFLEIFEYNQAIQLLDYVKTNYPNLDIDNNSLVLRSYSIAYINLDRMNEAQVALEKAFENLPENERYLYQLYETRYKYYLKKKTNLSFWFEKALYYAKKTNNITGIIFLYDSITDYSIETNTFVFVHDIAFSIIVDLKKYKNLELHKIYFKIISFLHKKNNPLLEQYLNNIAIFQKIL
jgi:tetratricopeptide (TPR) repeat protein